MASGPILLGPLRAKLAGPGYVRLAEPPESALALAVGELASDAAAAGCLYVARSEARAERLGRAVSGFAPEIQVIVLPAWDCLPYDRFSPSPSIMARRIGVLRDMARAAPPAGRLLLTTVESLLQRLPPASLCMDAHFGIAAGEPLSIDELKVYLIRAGYVLDERVDEPGEAALRGTIDVFPGADEQPFRLRLDNGRVAVIDRYDPVTQRTESSTGEAIIYPVSEVILDESQVRRFLQGDEEEGGEEESGEQWTRRLLWGTGDEPRRVPALEHWLPLFHQRLSTVFELLSEAPIILDAEVGERRDAWFEQIADAYRHRVVMAVASGTGHAGHFPPLPADRLYLDPAEWSRSLRGRRVIELGGADGESRESGEEPREPNEERGEADGELREPRGERGETVVQLGQTEAQEPEPVVSPGEKEQALDLGATAVPRFADGGDPFRAFARHIEVRRKAGDRVVLAAPAAEEGRRLATLVERRLGTGPDRLTGWEETAALKPGAVAVLPLDLAEGFAVDGWAVIAHADVFPGAARLAESPGKTPAQVFVGDGLRIGDLVVHSEHGIGQVTALELLEQNGGAHECL
ncbi:MAG: CarD family transcriptional regulator, partial [Allosphingosinicella sp.]